MVIPTLQNAPPALELRGRFGTPNGVGEMWCGWSVLGEDIIQSGVFQFHSTKKGMRNIKMNFCQQPNPQKENQQIWRGKFHDGVVAYHLLSDSEKLELKIRRYPRHMSGFNRFMSEYLKAHK